MRRSRSASHSEASCSEASEASARIEASSEHRPTCGATPASFKLPLFALETPSTHPGGWRTYEEHPKHYKLSRFLARMLQLKNEEDKDTGIFSPLEEHMKMQMKELTMAQLTTQIIAWLENEDCAEGFTAREGRETDFESLPPLLFSVHSVVARVVYALSHESAPHPLICFEIHSLGSSYTQTVAKMVAVCTDQLRLLMNLSPSFTEVRGFVLPNEAEKSTVTEVSVRWDSRFYFKFRSFPSREEARQVLLQWKSHMEAVSEQFKKNKPSKGEPTLLPLTPTEIQSFGAAAVQIGSDSSIIVYDDDQKLYYKWRYCTDLRREWDESMATSPVVVKPLQARKSLGMFLRFDEFPKTERMEADVIRERYLFPYIKAVYEALDMIHKRDNRAHLDVRFENTCFWVDDDEKEEEEKKQGGGDDHHHHHLMLIDFDRSQSASEYPAALYGMYRSNMYLAKDDWTTAQLDFKQLGLLIGRLLDASFDVENPSFGTREAKIIHPLMTSLIERGVWDEQAFERCRAAFERRGKRAREC